jgi:SSS family solute:Na+ symporter
MHMVLSVFVVVGYALVLTFVAVRARAAREFSEFSLANRRLGLTLVFGSLCATYVGPAFSIGFVGKGFTSGFLFWAIALAYAAQNLLVGFLVAPRLRALKGCHTLGDAIGVKYDRKCQVVAGIISVGLCAGFSAVMAKAGGVVLTNVFGMEMWPAVLIVVGVTALYTTFGGLRASVITDGFQFTAFAILLPVTLMLVLLFHVKGGLSGFATEARAATESGFGSLSAIDIIALAAAFFLGETLIPPYANRALASKTTAVSRNGFLLAGLFSIGWFMVMFSLGIAARGIVSPEVGRDDVLLSLVKTVMPAEGYALLLVVLVSVVMSSLDSLLNAGAVAFTQDIIKPFVKLPNGTALRVGRVATVAIAGVAALGAVAVPDIVKGLLMCYAVWAPAILPALIIGLWVKRPDPLAGILSMGVGTIVAVRLQFVFVEDAEKAWAILPALAASLLAYVLGRSITKLKGRV